jgi:lipopolysaccharide/colanic/teichoic acid biosynthesis glycosyltransferase/uncharacterized tellurite resistance protein B-like protein
MGQSEEYPMTEEVVHTPKHVERRELNEDDDAPVSVPPPSSVPRAYRITGLRPSSLPPPNDEPHIRAVADALLGAAHADGIIHDKELRAVRRILGRLMEVHHLPRWVECHIEEFDPATFDLTRTAETIKALPAVQRRHVVELVRQICDADNAFDLEEERYLVGLILAIALTPEDVADLVVHASDSVDGTSKRLFDILFSGAALFGMAPLLFGIALGVKLSSPGPALFKQRRYGRGAKEIEVWKFRTMSVQENGGTVTQATRDDPRVTRFGKFLRRTSLDELPQFFNVLTGDMSVVGPRPHAIAHNHLFRTQILEYMLRHKVRPGITGLAQVNGWRGETDTLEKMIGRVQYDIEYIRRHSLLLDLKIITKTALGRANRNAY